MIWFILLCLTHLAAFEFGRFYQRMKIYSPRDWLAQSLGAVPKRPHAYHTNDCVPGYECAWGCPVRDWELTGEWDWEMVGRCL